MHYGPSGDEISRTGPGFGQPLAPAPKRRRRWPYLAAAVVVLLAGGGTAAWALARSATPGTLTIAGQLDMPQEVSYGAREGAPCGLSRGFADITAGAQVTVTDEAGKVVGLGRLGTPAISLTGGASGTGYRCLTPFTVENVPAGHPFYGIEVTHRGVVRYMPDQLKSGQVQLRLGG